MIFLGRFRRVFVIMVHLKMSLKKEQKKFTEMSIEKDCHIWLEVVLKYQLKWFSLLLLYHSDELSDVLAIALFHKAKQPNTVPNLEVNINFLAFNHLNIGLKSHKNNVNFIGLLALIRAKESILLIK